LRINEPPQKCEEDWSDTIYGNSPMLASTPPTIFASNVGAAKAADANNRHPVIKACLTKVIAIPL
jgi:hypothetical protein